MKLTLILIVFVALSYVAANKRTIPPGGCPRPRSELKACFAELLDTDHNNIIGETEIQAFLDVQTVAGTGCLGDRSDAFKEKYTAQYVLISCDVDHDGVINASDWDSPNGCDNNPVMAMWLCKLCYMCGWSGAEATTTQSVLRR